MQLLQHEYFLFFANNVLAILLKMETFSGSRMFQSQKRSQSKNEDQEKDAILTEIFQGTIGVEVWIEAEESEKIQKDPEGTNSITILCHCSFQHNHKNRVYLQTYTKSTKWSTLGSRPNHFLEKNIPHGL